MSVEEAGPFRTMEEDYDVGEIEIQPTDGVFEVITAPLKGMMTWPELPEDGSNIPLVVLAHGRHTSSVENFRGLGYLAHHLSSHGYACASIDLNAVVGPQGTMVSKKPLIVVGGAIEHRARIILRTIVALRDHPRLKKVVNFKAVGLIGHSRGGEAVCRAAAEDEEAGGVFGIGAVFSLAPVDFTGVRLSKPLFLVSGNLDADVSDGQSIRLWDRAVGPRAGIYVSGAIHNYFSSNWDSEWDPSDEGYPEASQKILTRETHEGIARSYVTAFFDRNLKRKSKYEEMLCGAEPFPTLSHVRFERLLAFPESLVVDNFEGPFNASMNTLGGKCWVEGEIVIHEIDLERVRVDDTAFSALAKDLLRWKLVLGQRLNDSDKEHVESQIKLSSNRIVETLRYYSNSSQPEEVAGLANALSRLDPGFDPTEDGWKEFARRLQAASLPPDAFDATMAYLTAHNRASHAFNHLRKGLILSWAGRGASYTSEFNAMNVNGWRWLQLRLGQVYGADRQPFLNTLGRGQDLSVQLIDTSGKSATLRLAQTDGEIEAPWFEQRTFKGNMRTAILPVIAFGEQDVDLTAIKAISLVFDRTDAGTIAIDDISFSGREAVHA